MQGAQRSAESTSFLKVDTRKKQVTLTTSAAGPLGSTVPDVPHGRRPPRCSAFDAVFPGLGAGEAVGQPWAGWAGSPGQWEMVRPAPFSCRGGQEMMRGGPAWGLGAAGQAGCVSLPRWPASPPPVSTRSWAASQAQAPRVRPPKLSPRRACFPRDAPLCVLCLP